MPLDLEEISCKQRVPDRQDKRSSTTGPVPAKINIYDNAGNLTGDGTVTLAYSDRGRLASMTRTAGTVNYTYNGRGERIRKDGPTALVPGGLRYYAYDEAGHILGEYQQQGRPVQEYVWLGDIPVAVLVPQSSATSTEISVDDADATNTTATGTWTTAGTSKSHVTASGSPDRFEWRLNVTTAGSYDLYASWVSGGSQSGAAQYTLTVGSTNTLYTVSQKINGWSNIKIATVDLPVGQVIVRLAPSADGPVSADVVKLVGVTKPATKYAIHTDHLNAPRVITNAAGQMVWRWDTADPFGMTPPNENPSALGAFTMNMRLPGQTYDSESGLFQNYFRDYDPSLGRYVQSDPIGLVGGLNTYAYALARPNSNTDSKGLFLFNLHQTITNLAMNIAGFGMWKCPFLPTAVALVDKGTQAPEQAYIHAMSDAVHNQPATEARGLFEDLIRTGINSCSCDSLAMALHALQDSYAGGHTGFQGWPGGMPSPSHVYDDEFPKPEVFGAAVVASSELLRLYKEKCEQNGCPP